MVIEIKKEDNPEDIIKKLKVFPNKITEVRKARLDEYFGVLKIDEDAVKLQRRWRDEVSKTL